MSLKQALMNDPNEPKWTVGDDILSAGEMAPVFGWYSQKKEPEDAVRYMQAYMEMTGKYSQDHLDHVGQVALSSASFKPVYGWIARMIMRAAKMPEHETKLLDCCINSLLAQKPKAPGEKRGLVDGQTLRERFARALKKETERINGMLEEMRDKLDDLGEDPLEGMDLKQTMLDMGISRAGLAKVQEHWQKWYDELLLAATPHREKTVYDQEGYLVKSTVKSDLKEAYRLFSKEQMRRKIAFCKAVLDACGGVHELKAATTKKRRALKASSTGKTRKTRGSGAKARPGTNNKPKRKVFTMNTESMNETTAAATTSTDQATNNHDASAVVTKPRRKAKPSAKPVQGKKAAATKPVKKAAAPKAAKTPGQPSWIDAIKQVMRKHRGRQMKNKEVADEIVSSGLRPSISSIYQTVAKTMLYCEDLVNHGHGMFSLPTQGQGQKKAVDKV